VTSRGREGTSQKKKKGVGTRRKPLSSKQGTKKKPRTKKKKTKRPTEERKKEKGDQGDIG